MSSIMKTEGPDIYTNCIYYIPKTERPSASEFCKAGNIL